jgi:hypothetical protein
MSSGKYIPHWSQTMKPMFGLIACVVALGLLCMTGIAAAEETGTGTDALIVTDDIPPYEGPVGPGSPLYGLKLAWEDLDESFTADQTRQMAKQMTHASLRLSEARSELAKNRTASAQEAIDLYWQKINMTQAGIANYPANETGIYQAQAMHANHQLVLENLVHLYPDNTGLARAYHNSLQIQEKFQEKTQVRFERSGEKDNQTILKAYRLEAGDTNRYGQETGNDNRGAGNANTEEQRVNGTQRQQQGQDTIGQSQTTMQPRQQNGGNPQGSGNGNTGTGKPADAGNSGKK